MEHVVSTTVTESTDKVDAELLDRIAQFVDAYRQGLGLAVGALC